jgi:hypothetical protein
LASINKAENSENVRSNLDSDFVESCGSGNVFELFLWDTFNSSNELQSPVDLFLDLGSKFIKEVEIEVFVIKDVSDEIVSHGTKLAK